MEKKYSLNKIMKEVIEEKHRMYGINQDGIYESKIKSMSRWFKILIKKLGGDVEVLKNDKNNFEFKEEYFIVKFILSQFYDEKGMIYNFVIDKNKNFSSREVHKLIQEICNAGDREGMTESEIIELAKVFSSIFLESPLRSIEYCHALIDSFALNLQDLTSEQKAEYLLKYENILKKEFAIRYVELALNAERLGYLIDERRNLVGDDIYSGEFFEYDPTLRYYYMERDKELLEKIQEDEDLRYYIEKKIGKKAEEIFNYAALNK